VEAEKSTPEIAREAVTVMGALFAVERQAKDVSIAERLELRQKQSVSILAELHRKLLIWKLRYPTSAGAAAHQQSGHTRWVGHMVHPNAMKTDSGPKS
jgi:hypothetical protein